MSIHNGVSLADTTLKQGKSQGFLRLNYCIRKEISYVINSYVSFFNQKADVRFPKVGF